jgi:GNAT superfamily N-acetyltransferase
MADNPLLGLVRGVFSPQNALSPRNALSPVTGQPMYYPPAVSNPSPTVRPMATSAAEAMGQIGQEYLDPSQRGLGVSTVLGFTEGPAQVKAGRGVVIADNGALHLGGEQIGRIKLDQAGGAQRIASIEISPSYQNQGLGSEVIRMVQEQAAANGRPVVLTTDAMRGKAAQAGQRRLYERLGFVPNSGPEAVRERIGKRSFAEEMVWRPKPPE